MYILHIFTPIIITTMDAIGVKRTFRTLDKKTRKFTFWVEFETIKKETVRRSFSEAGFRDIQIEF